MRKRLGFAPIGAGNGLACGNRGGGDPDVDGGSETRRDGGPPATLRDGRSVDASNPLTDPEDGPPAGNPDGDDAIPVEAGPEDTSSPDHVVGTGTPAS